MLNIVSMGLAVLCGFVYVAGMSVCLTLISKTVCCITCLDRNL